MEESPQEKAVQHQHGAAVAPAQAGEEPASEDAGNQGEKQLLEAAETHVVKEVEHLEQAEGNKVAGEGEHLEQAEIYQGEVGGQQQEVEQAPAVEGGEHR